MENNKIPITPATTEGETEQKPNSGNWISVDVALPGHTFEVLTKYENGNYKHYEVGRLYDREKKSFLDSAYESSINVTHWMYIPGDEQTKYVDQPTTPPQQVERESTIVHDSMNYLIERSYTDHVLSHPCDDWVRVSDVMRRYADEKLKEQATRSATEIAELQQTINDRNSLIKHMKDVGVEQMAENDRLRSENEALRKAISQFPSVERKVRRELNITEALKTDKP